jgi:hypothetical protein
MVLTHDSKRLDEVSGQSKIQDHVLNLKNLSQEKTNHTNKSQCLILLFEVPFNFLNFLLKKLQIVMFGDGDRSMQSATKCFYVLPS